MVSKMFVVLGVLAVAVFGAPEGGLDKRASGSATTTPGINTVSALAVLESVVPQSLQNLAITKPASASALLASEFANGNTPSWFKTLPKDVQTFLVPATTINEAPGVLLSALPTGATILKNATVSTPKPTPSMNATMPYGTNGTSGVAGATGGAGSNSTGRMNMTATGASTGSKKLSGMMTSSAMSTSKMSSGASSSSGTAGSGSGSGSSSSGNAGAGMPTAAYGAGFAGMVGLAALAAL